jgi:hypothetical protein
MKRFRAGAALGALLALSACHGDDVPSRVADAPEATSQAGATATSAAADRSTQPGLEGSGAPSAGTDPLVPRRTHAGNLQFAGPDVDGNAALAPRILARLSEEPSSELRVALVEALPRTGGDWFDGAYAQLGREPDAAVRKAIVAIMPRAEASRALQGILAGLGDAAPGVRAEAALAAGSLPPPARDHASLHERLAQLLSDADSRARASAARTLGILGRSAAFDLVVNLLSDADPEVRLQAVHALERIDRTRARQLARLEVLRSDPDPKVARAASSLLAP